MSALTDTRDQWQARFAKLEARERQMVVVIGLLLAFLFVWLVFVRPAWQTLDDAPAQRAQADAEGIRFKLSDLRYRNGIASALDLLDAQRSQFAAQQATVQVHLLQLQNQVVLYKALGGGWKE